VPICATLAYVSETTAAPVAPVAAQPAAPAAPAAPGNTTVNVHLPPDLLRMAGLPQQGQPAAPAVAQPAAQAAPAAPVTKADEKPATKADDDLAKRFDALEAKHRATLIRAEIDRVALVAGAIDPAVVAQLIGGELDVTDDGKVIAKGDPRTTGEQTIARFLASKPYLLKPAVPGGGSGAPSTITAPVQGTPLNMSNNDNATALARAIAAKRGFRLAQ